MRAAGSTTGTLRLRRHYVTMFARQRRRGPWRVTTDELVDWVASPGWSTETRRSARASVRGFYTWATLTGRTETNPSQALPAIGAKRAVADPAPERILREAVQRSSPRDGLMVRLSATAGLRRSEVAGLHSRDVREGLDGWALHVTGKGGHQRRIPVPDTFARDLLRHATTGPDGWVFPGPRGHLSPDHVGRLIATALPGRWTAHKLRHRFATVAHRASNDSFAVKELMGHAKLDTTMGYVQLPDDALRRAASATWDVA